jgi:hypothetical protein
MPLCRIPVATVSALIPGPNVTHAAIKACGEGQYVRGTDEESLRFYAFGLAPNHINGMLLLIPRVLPTRVGMVLQFGCHFHSSPSADTG